MESLINDVRQEVKDNSKSARRNERKPISEFKVIQHLAPLIDDKMRFREWNARFVSAMGQFDPLYGKAIKNIMHWADCEEKPRL